MKAFITSTRMTAFISNKTYKSKQFTYKLRYQEQPFRRTDKIMYILVAHMLDNIHMKSKFPGKLF